MTDTSERLCGRVDGAIACASSCWRQAAGLDTEPCPEPVLRRPCGCPVGDPHPNTRCASRVTR